MPARRTPKVEALVVNAIRRLQDVQGSTSREISNYISQEYDIPSEETRRQIQFALRRGLSYGILKRSRGGYYSCNHDYLGSLSLGNGDGVTEPCPSQPWRFGVRKRKREKRRRRLAQRRRRERERRKRGPKGRERRKGRRGRSRVRRRRRPSRRRRRGRRRTRRRTRSRRRGGRARTRADPGGMEMETMYPEPGKNDADRKDEDSRKSETSVSEHSVGRHSQNSAQNSQSLNTCDNI